MVPTNHSTLVQSELPEIITPPPGPRARAVIARDEAVISPSYTRNYPLVAQRASGCIVEDMDGNRYLDMNAGIAVAATGHCHPAVVRAIQMQAAELIHMSGTDFYYPNMVELAERLARLAPGRGAHRVYFGNSGTEAVEAAIKLARYVTGRDKFLAFYGGFHGRTMGSLSLTASRSRQRQGFGPLLAGVFHAPYPDSYRNGLADGERSIRFIKDTLFRQVLPPEEVAAIIVEPVQGEGGYVIPPPEFLQQLRRLADEHGILLVADEVQSGFGRTGKMFAIEHFGVEPDILATAKGIASGMPLSATIARAELMNWPAGSHASTFGGNPVAVAAALATLDLIEGGLMENAARMGGWLLARMAEWPKRFQHVGDVRGLGLMIGIEIVTGGQSRARDAAFRDRLVQMAFEQGVLVLGAGVSAIRISPPLLLNQQQAEYAAATLERCLTALEAGD
ncbi:MAG: acetyl ornithine aminotransferase family protein [Bryobacterales bacterium]|nr:acetyl ornithine aminotransferase family protein [Bryobacterales bacterium]